MAPRLFRPYAIGQAASWRNPMIEIAVLVACVAVSLVVTTVIVGFATLLCGVGSDARIDRLEHSS